MVIEPPVIVTAGMFTFTTIPFMLSLLVLLYASCTMVMLLMAPPPSMFPEPAPILLLMFTRGLAVEIAALSQSGVVWMVQSVIVQPSEPFDANSPFTEVQRVN